MVVMRKEAFKISGNLVKAIKKLKAKDGSPVTWHIERAVLNYLKAKKVEV